MKIILEFDSIEEAQDARTALDGINWKRSVRDLDQKLRETIRYGTSVLASDKSASNIEVEVAEKYRELIREILEQYSLNIELK